MAPRGFQRLREEQKQLERLLKGGWAGRRRKETEAWVVMDLPTKMIEECMGSDRGKSLGRGVVRKEARDEEEPAEVATGYELGMCWGRCEVSKLPW